MPILPLLLALQTVPDAPTINAFFARGTPTFVLGTSGDARCDRALAGQVNMLRENLFQGAPVVADDALDAKWPANPIVYGGAHVNALVKSVAKELPFSVDAGRIEIAGQRFEGDEYRLMAFVPADNGYPDFLLYAGAASPGVEEINSIKHGPEGFVVCDRFGALVRGAWKRDGDKWKAEPGPRARRIEWRTSSPSPERLRVQRAVLVAAASDEPAQDAAIERGLKRAEEMLGLRLGAPLEVIVYPDRNSKRSLCGNPGDGHADAVSRSVHVIACDGSEGGPLEDLIAHEATHVLAAHALGPPGSVLLGEGIAVWVSGQYGGRTLEDWARSYDAPLPSIEELMGPRFKQLPEATTYPLAGIYVATLLRHAGRGNLLEVLYPAGASDWSEACERSKTSAERVEQDFRAAFAR